MYVQFVVIIPRYVVTRVKVELLVCVVHPALAGFHTTNYNTKGACLTHDAQLQISDVPKFWALTTIK